MIIDIITLIVVLLNLGLSIYLIINNRKDKSPSDESIDDLYNNSDEEEIEGDDSTYETKIHEVLTIVGANIYYENYTNSSVKITGMGLSTSAVELRNIGETKTLAEWEHSRSYRIKFVFRFVLNEHSYLVWGEDRESAYLNLYEFIILHTNIHE